MDTSQSTRSSRLKLRDLVTTLILRFLSGDAIWHVEASWRDGQPIQILVVCLQSLMTPHFPPHQTVLTFSRRQISLASIIVPSVSTLRIASPLLPKQHRYH